MYFIMYVKPQKWRRKFFRLIEKRRIGTYTQKTISLSKII